MFQSCSQHWNKSFTKWKWENKFEEWKHRILETEDESGAFKANLNIDLKGNEDVLKDSEYLKASFEQIVKDYINNDIKSENESEGTPTPDVQNVVVREFYTNLGIEFDSNERDECNYDGISCDENGRVTRIALGMFHHTYDCVQQFTKFIAY